MRLLNMVRFSDDVSTYIERMISHYGITAGEIEDLERFLKMPVAKKLDDHRSLEISVLLCKAFIKIEDDKNLKAVKKKRGRKSGVPNSKKIGETNVS